jgi:GTP-dependent phosphoenolpyruvate carboxykinase
MARQNHKALNKTDRATQIQRASTEAHVAGIATYYKSGKMSYSTAYNRLSSKGSKGLLVAAEMAVEQAYLEEHEEAVYARLEEAKVAFFSLKSYSALSAKTDMASFLKS